MLTTERKNSVLMLGGKMPNEQYKNALGTGYTLWRDVHGQGARGRKNHLRVAGGDESTAGTAQSRGADTTVEATAADARYCSCKCLVSSDDPGRDMVQCDNEGCPVEWYHVECTTLDARPAESEPWTCALCVLDDLDTDTGGAVGGEAAHVDGGGAGAAAALAPLATSGAEAASGDAGLASLAVAAAAADERGDAAAAVLQRNPISGFTHTEEQRFSAMGEADLLGAARLSPRYSSYAPKLTGERLRALKATIALHQRHDMPVGEHFAAAIRIYEQAGWAVKVMQTADGASGRKHVQVLRVMLQSPAMRGIVDKYPHVCDVSAIDATFTVGSMPIHTYAWVGHLPESGGDAIPLSFMLTLAAPDDDVPTRTDNIRWFFEQCLQRGLSFPELVLVDKCAATFKALALVAHERMASEAGKSGRAAAVTALERGAAGSTALERDAARRLLSAINADAAVLPAVSAGGVAIVDPLLSLAAPAGGAATAAIDPPPLPAAPMGGIAATTIALPPLPAAPVGGVAATTFDPLPLRFPRVDELLPPTTGGDPAPVGPAQQDVLAAILKPEVIAAFGRLAPALCAVLLEDLDDAERKRQSGATRSFAAFQDAHDHLFVHAALWRRGGVVGAFLRRYCLLSAALCYFHAKAAMLKRAQTGDTGLVKGDRAPAIEAFFASVVRVAASHDEALKLFEAYEREWSKCAGATWFAYVRDNWLSPAWCSLLLLSKRDRCARLFLLTTNSVELLWKNIKGSWLRGLRVADFAYALLTFVGAPNNIRAARTSVVGKALFNVDARLMGQQRRSEKRAPFQLIRSVARLAHDVEAGAVRFRPAEDGAPGVFTLESSAPVAQYASPPADAPTSAAARHADYPVASFYTSTSTDAASAGAVATRSERIAATVARVHEVATASGARGGGAAAVGRSGRAGDDSSNSTPLTAVVRRRADDVFGVVSQYRGLRFQYAGVGEAYVHPATCAALVAVNQARLAVDTLREGVGRGYTGKPLSRSYAMTSLAAIQATAPVVVDVTGHASSSAAGASEAAPPAPMTMDATGVLGTAPVPLSPANEEALRLNRLQHDGLCSAWEAVQRADFDDDPPSVAYVYAVPVGVPASELDVLCDAYLRRGENVSRMDGGPVPWGLRLMLLQAEPLAAALVAAGRGGELLYVTYVGLECRGEDSTTRFTRVWDHLMGKRSGTAHGPGSAVLDQLVRWTSKRPGGRVLSAVSSTARRAGQDVLHVRSTWRRVLLAILPLKEHIVYATEALLGAAVHGVGGIVANESPTGELQRYLARGWRGEPSRAEDDLDALITSVTVSGAQRSRLYVVRDALLAPQLYLTQRWLAAGIFRDTSGSVIVPALADGEYSLWQCISALSSRETCVVRQPFDVVPYADFCGRCGALRRRASPCRHLIYARGFIVTERKKDGSSEELPWWSMDLAMYLNFAEFSAALPASNAAAEASAGVETRFTAAGVETVASAFEDILRLHCRFMAAALLDVGAEVNSKVHTQLAAVRAVLQTVVGDSPSGAIATSATTPPSPPADELVDVARALRYEEALRTAAGHARGALGDAPRLRRERGHGGGRPGPLDKSARSADEVHRNHDRLVPVPAPPVELVMAAVATPTTLHVAASPPALVATGSGGMSLDGTIGGSPLGERNDNVASQDVVAAPAGLPGAAVAAGSGGAARAGSGTGGPRGAPKPVHDHSRTPDEARRVRARGRVDSG